MAANAFDTRLPVGIITGALGAPFLLWLLVTAPRTGRGAHDHPTTPCPRRACRWPTTGRRWSCDLSLTLPSGRITTIVGANACGKSTLLRGLARLMAPSAGRVLLDGQPITDLPSRQVARTLGLLPQSPTAAGGHLVADLVGRGRSPTRAGSARGPRTTSAPSPAPSR
jgi:hypothetical protein